MYKLTKPDGYDFYSGTINYRDNIGKIIRVTGYDPPKKGSCGKGLHASRNPNDCFVGAMIPCAAFKVKGIQPIAKDEQKTRYQALKVIEEVHDLDSLFGWKYSEVCNPVHPFKIKPQKITEKHLDLLQEWDSIRYSAWASVWDSVKASINDSLWYSIRYSVWASACDSVWASVWDSVWDLVWGSVRDSVRDSVWASIWDSIWDSIRYSVWAYIGSLFPNIKKWKYINIKHAPGEYPFQAGVDLWNMGLVPSYNGSVWRLHGGPEAKILWEGAL